MGDHAMKQELQHCIQECLECHRICLETFSYCAEQGGDYADPDQFRVLLDCSQICQTSADFMIRSSQLHSLICETCAEVCTQCQEECEMIEGDPQMKACAEACRRCAESCQQMAA